MRYGRPDVDDYVESRASYHAPSGHREERSLLARISWRAWLAIGLIAALLIGCPTAVLFLVALISDPRGTSARMTALFQESLTTAAIALPLVVGLLLAYATRHVWYAWIVKPVHARANRFPVLVDVRGHATMLDNQKPRYDDLRSIHAGNNAPLLEEHRIDDPLLAAPEDRLIPERGLWESVRAGIYAGHYFLGWTLEGELWGSLETMLTMCAVGKQGFGKTSLARLLALQAAMTGGQVVIWDWYNDIAAEGRDFFTHCYSEPEDIERSAEQLAGLMRARRAEYAAGQRDFAEVFLVVDEWIQLEPHCPMAKKVIQDGLEIGRKIGIRFYIASVRLPAKTIGEAFSKGNVETTYIFVTSTQAAATFEITGAQGELLMSALFKAGKGYCIVRSARLGLEGSILALPDLSPEIFRQELTRLRHRHRIEVVPRVPAPSLAARFSPSAPPDWMDDLPEVPALPVNPALARSHPEAVCVEEPPAPVMPRRDNIRAFQPPTHTLTHKVTRVSDEQRVFILEKTAEGKSPSAIAILLWNDAHKNVIVRQVLAEAQEAEDGSA